LRPAARRFYRPGRGKFLGTAGGGLRRRLAAAGVAGGHAGQGGLERLAVLLGQGGAHRRPRAVPQGGGRLGGELAGLPGLPGELHQRLVHRLVGPLVDLARAHQRRRGPGAVQEHVRAGERVGVGVLHRPRLVAGELRQRLARVDEHRLGLLRVLRRGERAGRQLRAQRVLLRPGRLEDRADLLLVHAHARVGHRRLHAHEPHERAVDAEHALVERRAGVAPLARGPVGRLRRGATLPGARSTLRGRADDVPQRLAALRARQRTADGARRAWRGRSRSRCRRRA
jgi:hypothetical protein